MASVSPSPAEYLVSYSSLDFDPMSCVVSQKLEGGGVGYQSKHLKKFMNPYCVGK